MEKTYTPRKLFKSRVIRNRKSNLKMLFLYTKQNGLSEFVEYLDPTPWV